MKNILLLFIGLFVFTFADAQLKVNSSGNVGVKNANPLTSLHVKGDMTFSPEAIGIEGGQLNFNDGSDANNWVIDNFGDPGLMRFIRPGVGQIVFINPNNGGRFGIGAGAWNPSEKLHVDGSIFITGSYLPSDKRLKTGIQPMQYGLNEVLQLNPISYYYNNKTNYSHNTKQIGVIAQELQKVAPDLVSDFVISDLDEKTAKAVNEASYLKINDTAIKYMLINAIKEQQTLIEEKEDRINSLEDKFQELEKLVQSLSYGELEHQIEISLTKYELASLEQNIPNPFSGSTQIDYIIPSNSQSAQIQIYDFDAKLIRTVQLNHKGKGNLTINAIDIPAGTYSYQLIVDGKSIEAKKMVIAN